LDSPSRLSPIPDRVGPFPVVRAIASGGTGVVFEVRDPHSGEPLALKWLTTRNPGSLDRFNLEYEVMNSLNHPNILRVDRYGVEDGLPWMTMEMVVGTPVQASCRDAGSPGSANRTAHALRVAYSLTLALDHIHTRGLLHRDLKSANLLVIEDGRCKLLDFGAARFLVGHEPLTAEGEFLGTFAYASPEQLTGEVLDPRADLYSFGVLLYRMLTGKRPFNGATPQELARQHMERKPPHPHKYAPELPLELVNLTLQLLAKRREDRPADAAGVAQALAGVADEELGRPPRVAIAAQSTRLVGREGLLSRVRHVLAKRAPGSALVVCGESASGRRAVRAALDELTDSEGLHALRLDASQLERAQERVATAIDDGIDVLRIADLQHASDTALDHLSDVVRDARVRQLPLVLLADWEVSTAHPLDRLRARLANATVANLEPLDTQGVGMLVGALLHRRPPPHALARRVRLATGGHPTYIETVVAELIERQVLLPAGPHGVRLEWVRGGEDLDIPIPEAATHHVHEELTRLPSASRRVLEVLAVLGREGGSYEALGACFNRPASALQAVAQPLIERGWVHVDRGQITFAHSVARTLIAEAAEPARLRAIDAALTRAIDALPLGATRVRLLAQAERLPQAADEALELVRARLRSMCPIAALEVLTAVLASPRLATLPSATQADLHLLHATALQLAHPGHREAGSALLRARAAERSPSPRLSARLALQRARAHRVLGHYPKYRSYLEQAWALVDPLADADVGAVVASLLARAHHVTGELPQAGAWHQRATRCGRRAGELERRLADAGELTWVLACGGVERAGREAAVGTKAALIAGDVRSLSLFLPTWTDALSWQARFSDLDATLSPALTQLRACEVPTYYLRGLLGSARAEVALGRLGRAQERVDELASSLRTGEHLDLRLEVGLVATRILLDSGELHLALDRANDLMKRAAEPGFTLVVEAARALWAEAAWRSGRVDVAASAFDRATAVLQRAGALPALAEAIIGWARAEGQACNPLERFAPVRAWAGAEPVVRLRIEMELARARTSAPGALAAAQTAVARLLSEQRTSEAAALRVHRWSRELRLLHLAATGASAAARR